MTETLLMATAADGTAIAYQHFGEGPRLITCLHSLALDGSWYAPLAQALGDDYRLVAPDFRGHGATARGESPIDLHLMAQDVAAVWDAENVESSAILGISLGGMVAQAITGSHLSRVDAQVLMATRGAFDAAASDGTRARATAVREPGGLAEAADVTMHRWFGNDCDIGADPLVRKAREQFVGADGNTIADYFEAMTQVGDFHVASPPPTLVVGGEGDDSTPHEVIEQLAASIPNADLQFVRGGHLAAFDDPDEVAATIRPFLDGLDCWPR